MGYRANSRNVPDEGNSATQEFSARSEKLCLLLSFEQIADLGGNAFLGLDQSHADCIAEGDCVGAAMAGIPHGKRIRGEQAAEAAC